MTRHAHLARSVGTALTYPADVATFAAVPPAPLDSDWDDLARLLGPGGLADLFGADVTAPPDWEPLFGLDGFQLVLAAAGDEAPTAPIVQLGPKDVVEMTALAERTAPGPFWPRSIELGEFLGIRCDGHLVAMAGERLCPPGWREISTVCTAPEARGRGLAAQLVNATAQRIIARGDRAFLHVAASNPGALRLYRRLGFVIRRTVRFHGYRTP